MEEPWDVFGWQTDTWGVTRYSLVVHTPDVLTRRIMAFRREIGLGDLTSEPHVSLIASMHQPIDQDVLKRKVQKAVAGIRPMRCSFEAGQVTHGKAGGVIAVAQTSDLLDLRHRLVSAVQGSIHLPSAAKPFLPHVTLYQMAGATEAEAARRVAPHHDFGDGFDVARIDLVGRVGPPRGGTREVIAEFLMGSERQL